MPRLNPRNKKNGTRVKTKPGYSYRVYCSNCDPPNLGHPEVGKPGSHFVVVDGTHPPRHIKCASGHITPVAH